MSHLGIRLNLKPPTKVGGLVLRTESPDTGQRPVVSRFQFGSYLQPLAQNDAPDTLRSLFVLARPK